MNLTEGKRLKLLADELKETKGTTRAQLAQKLGITPEHLSHVFRWRRLSDELRERAINTLDLPQDFFSPEADKPALVPPPGESEEITKYREKVVSLLEEVRQWKAKYQDVAEKLLKTQDEYLEHLKKNQNTE